MARAIIFDTETTGLDPATGDRVIELACIELENDVPTGKVLHHLFNPGREISEAASRVHGLTLSDLLSKPNFRELAREIREFFGDSRYIAHNAPFDYAFMNAELARAGVSLLDPTLMIDTLALANAAFHGAPNSLDALCKRFGIDTSMRVQHSALIDSKLLTEVYIQLIGGRQRLLTLETKRRTSDVSYCYEHQTDLPTITASGYESELHQEMLMKLRNPIWMQY